MPKWLRRLLWKVYGIENKEISRCTLVVPLGYGLTMKDELPKASRETLVIAAARARGMSARLAFANSSYFGLGSQVRESAHKKILLRQLGFQNPEDVIVAERGIRNTIEEVMAIRDQVAEIPNLSPVCVVIVCDWAHARRAQYVFRKVFPGSKVLTLSVVSEWGSENRVWFQKSEMVWFCANVAYDLLTRILGMRIMSKLQHPLQEK